MEQIILISLMLLMLFANLSLSMLFFLHMFQLNSYSGTTQLKWIKSKFTKEVLARNCWLLIPLVASLSSNLIILITGIVISYVLMIRVNRKKDYKKPLKYTARVNRLIITTGLLNIAVLILGINLSSLWQTVLLLSIWTILMPVLIILSNLINKPMEKCINKHYINEARKKLKDMPSLTVIGITGSYGKTSTKYFLNKLLSTKYNVLMTPGNFNTTLGVVKTVREKLKATDEIFLCEMGARHVNDVKEICDLVNPKYGIISSIGPQHLETFFTIENVVKTKFELCDAISKDGKIFLNYDNDYIKNKKVDKNVVSYGINEENTNYRSKDIKVDAKGSTFTVIGNNEEQEFRTPIIGKHNVENIVGAIAVANQLGIPMSDLVLAVRKLEPVPHRLQLVKGNNGTIIDDAYNSNPVGAKAALDTLNAFNGTKILITPGMVELGEKQDECNNEFGRQSAEICDYIVLVGKEQTKSIKNGILEKGYDESKLIVVDTFNEGMKEIVDINVEKEKFVLIENDLPDNY